MDVAASLRFARPRVTSSRRAHNPQAIFRSLAVANPPLATAMSLPSFVWIGAISLWLLRTQEAVERGPRRTQPSYSETRYVRTMLTLVNTWSCFVQRKTRPRSSHPGGVPSSTSPGCRR
jgi:hypothetical protein